MHLRRSLDRLIDSLKDIYGGLPDDWRLFTEHKPYEPAFYSTVVQDWGTSLMVCRELGERAQALVDLGHHLPNTNVEMVVARLVRAGKLGGFHFNDSQYGDDDLTTGSIRPYQLFLVFHELVDAILDSDVDKERFRPAYMIDQSHNLKDPIEALIGSVEEIRRAYARALLVDRAALDGFQQSNDVMMSEKTLRDAFEVDVRPILALARYRTRSGDRPDRGLPGIALSRGEGARTSRGRAPRRRDRLTPPSRDARRGICCSGNWIIDHVKTIDTWPAEETLANILSEEIGTGGHPYNVSVDLSRFGLGLPVEGLGLVGDDADGERILEDCGRWGIDTRHLRKVSGQPTAYTDVMNVADSGRRTFFHNRGANALLGPEHYPIEELECRILTLGYLLLLDALDAEDAEHGTAAARVLARARAAGILTAVDVVSEDSDRFARIVTPALPHTDYLIINEIEAGRTTGRELRPDGKLDARAVEAAASDLVERGVKRLVVIHTPEAAFGLGASGGPRVWKAALDLPDSFVQGTVGAGDAFFAGLAVGIHEGWELERSLTFANAAAASCLGHATCTGGVRAADEIWKLAEEFPERSL